MDYYRRWVGDYMRDTSDLSLIEHGAYNTLLDCYYANNGAISSNLDALCRMVRAFDPAERAAVARIVKRYFTADGERLVHSRCDAELAHVGKVVDRRRYAAMERWRVAPVAPDVPLHDAHASANAEHTDSTSNAHASDDVTEQGANADANASIVHMQSKSISPSPSPSPSPNPNPNPNPRRDKSARKPQATGIEHESLSAYRRDFAVSRVPDIDPDRTWQDFADHHAKLANRFVDWNAAWRTWVRNIADKGYPYAKVRHSRAAVADQKFDHTGAPMVDAAPSHTNTLAPEEAAANVKRLRAIARRLPATQPIRAGAVSTGIQRPVAETAPAPDADVGDGADESRLPF